MIHVVAYDLKTPNDKPEDYERVIGAIKESFDSWCHLEKSVWLIDTAMDAGDVRDHLESVLNAKDILFLARLQGNWATLNCGDERNQWLKTRTY